MFAFEVKWTKNKFLNFGQIPRNIISKKKINFIKNFIFSSFKSKFIKSYKWRTFSILCRISKPGETKKLRRLSPQISPSPQSSKREPGPTYLRFIFLRIRLIVERLLYHVHYSEALWRLLSFIFVDFSCFLFFNK